MKKAFYVFIVAAVGFMLLAGCAKESAPVEKATETAEPQITDTPVETNATEEQENQPQLLDPKQVALQFALETLGLQGEAVLTGEAEKEYARVTFTKQNGEEIHIDLYQPAVKGKDGIWEVHSWFDENNRQHMVRDLSKMPPIFHNDENVPLNIREAVRNAIVKDWSDTFSAYYQVLGFEANNVRYTNTGGVAEVKFIMTLVTQSYYKDPDTVQYIKEAKEKGSDRYQQLYDEYNMPKTANVDLMATIEIGPGGEIKPDTIQIFSNASPHGEEYLPVSASDYIIK